MSTVASLPTYCFNRLSEGALLLSFERNNTCRTLAKFMLLNNLVSTFTVCAVIQVKAEVDYRNITSSLAVLFLSFLLIIALYF